MWTPEEGIDPFVRTVWTGGKKDSEREGKTEGEAKEIRL